MPYRTTGFRRLALAASLALVVPPLAAQQPPAPATGFGERIEVREALLDVLVTDRDGNVVLGLEPDDFRVEVDGRPAEVTSATFYSNRRFLDAAGAERLGVDPRAIPDRRIFVLVVDDQRVASLQTRGLLQRQLEAGRALDRWLRQELLPSDLVAVLGFDGSLRLQSDLTSDLETLEAAVDRAVRGEEAPGNWPSRRAATATTPSIAAGLPDEERLRSETTRIQTALTVLGGALGRIPGRKNLLLLTTGFGDVGPFGQYRPDPRFHRAMIESLNAANVAVYPIDLFAAGTRHSFEGSFANLAGATGGEPFLNVVGFGVPLERIARETNGYYLVSVRAEPGTGNGYREVRVEAVNPEFRIRSRRGLGFRGDEPDGDG